MTSKVKVSTDRLLAAVKARRDRIVKDHEKAQTKYEQAVERTRVTVVKTLRDHAERVEKGGDLPSTGYNCLNTPWRGVIPQHPGDLSRRVAEIDRLIATLEIASDPTISISADDAAQYLG